MGIVFQFFQLLPTLTALENLIFFAKLYAVADPQTRALAMLERVEGTTVYWGIWAQFHPDTVILAEEPTKKQKKAYKKRRDK